MWYEVKEGITQQSTRGKAEQHLEQVLVLVAVWLNWDQKQDEERSRTDQQGGSDSLQTGMEEFTFQIPVGETVNRLQGQQEMEHEGEREISEDWSLQLFNKNTNNDMTSLLLRCVSIKHFAHPKTSCAHTRRKGLNQLHM